MPVSFLLGNKDLLFEACRSHAERRGRCFTLEVIRFDCPSHACKSRNNFILCRCLCWLGSGEYQARLPRCGIVGCGRFSGISTMVAIPQYGCSSIRKQVGCALTCVDQQGFRAADCFSGTVVTLGDQVLEGILKATSRCPRGQVPRNGIIGMWLFAGRGHIPIIRLHGTWLRLGRAGAGLLARQTPTGV